MIPVYLYLENTLRNDLFDKYFPNQEFHVNTEMLTVPRVGEYVYYDLFFEETIENKNGYSDVYPRAKVKWISHEKRQVNVFLTFDD